jgi:hypothetical protein
MAEASKTPTTSFKVNDRVKRVSGEGCVGTIAEVRYETTGRDEAAKEKNPIIAVLWDNGTQTVVGSRGIVSAK